MTAKGGETPGRGRNSRMVYPAGASCLWIWGDAAQPITEVSSVLPLLPSDTPGGPVLGDAPPCPLLLPSDEGEGKPKGPRAVDTVTGEMGVYSVGRAPGLGQSKGWS